MSHYVEQDTWYIQEQYGRQGATAYFVMRDEVRQTAPHQTNLTLVCKPLSKVTFTDTTSGIVLFAGLLTDPTMVFLDPTIIEYRASCRDFTYYADSRLVTGTYLNKTVKQIIADVVANSNTGITVDPGMPDGPLITAVQFDHQTISDVVDQLSELASWQSDYAFYVDFNLVLHWGNEASAPVSGVKVTDIVDQPQSTTRAYIDKRQTWTYEWDGTTIRNKCTVRGASKNRSQTDTWNGDGTTTQWQLAFDFEQAGNVTLTVAGTARTIEVTSDPSHTTREFALYQAPNGQWSVIKGTATVPAAGEAIVLTYTAAVPITMFYENPTSETQYDGPNGGVFEVFLADNTIKDATMALARARSEVQQYGNAQERFAFSISEDWTGHLTTGQIFTVESSYIPDAQIGWSVGLTDTYIVTACEISGRVHGRRQYAITAVRVVANA